MKIACLPLNRGFRRAFWLGTLGVLACLAWLGPAPAAGSSGSSSKSKSSTESKKKSSATNAEDTGRLFAEDHPVLVLEGLRCQVHEEGVIRQDITADTGRYDETAKVLDLDSLKVNFKDQGTTLGLVTCGKARVWMADDPKQKVGMHDMLMQNSVHLRSNDNWVIQTPEMRYVARDSLLSSNKGYLKQFPLKEGFLVGRGTGFEIKLLLETKTFEYCREFGDPAEYRKSTEPVMKP